MTIEKKFNTFYHTFISEGIRNTEFASEVNNSIEETFKQYVNATLDKNLHFDLADIITALEEKYSSNINVKILNDLLLIRSNSDNNVVIKFYDTGVLVPEIIGALRKEWFERDEYEKIKWRAVLSEPNIFADTYISSQVGHICINGIDAVYTSVWEDVPIRGLIQTISEVFPDVKST